jgi:hypothetical protein
MAAEDDVRVDHQAQGVAPPIINDDSRPSIARGRHSVLVLITDVHRGMIPALEYALSFGSDHITAVHVDLDSEITEQLRVQWQQWELAIPSHPSIARPLAPASSAALCRSCHQKLCRS